MVDASLFDVSQGTSHYSMIIVFRSRLLVLHIRLRFAMMEMSDVLLCSIANVQSR